ncbi:MAG: hypothetical protein HYT72_00905 [Candidatus Aenigmarchaeota archaeon]|nr:hypothetical protein [Candidatus Aenigmarchaeota archaeon]
MKNFSEKLEDSDSIVEVFSLVKEAVDCTLAESRAGLNLGFVELGNSSQCVFAFYPVGSNIIVMNKTPIRRVMETKPEFLKPYVFTTLLHEYLHSLGYLNEFEVRKLTCAICKRLFGNGVISEFACGIERYLPYVTYPGGSPATENEIQVLEIEEQDYIG